MNTCLNQDHLLMESLLLLRPHMAKFEGQVQRYDVPHRHRWQSKLEKGRGMADIKKRTVKQKGTKCKIEEKRRSEKTKEVRRGKMQSTSIMQIQVSVQSLFSSIVSVCSPLLLHPNQRHKENSSLAHLCLSQTSSSVPVPITLSSTWRRGVMGGEGGCGGGYPCAWCRKWEREWSLDGMKERSRREINEWAGVKERGI